MDTASVPGVKKCACARLMVRNNPDGTKDHRYGGKSSCTVCHGYAHVQTCATCDGCGMLAGKRCELCGGNGVVPERSGIRTTYQ